MTRKHFKQLADIVGEIHAIHLSDHQLSTKGLLGIIQWKILEFCKNNNDRFDEDRFSEAVNDKYEEVIEQLNNLNTD